MTPYILNLLDLAFTLHALGHGAVELNPAMQNVPFMIAYKVVVVGAVIWWISTRDEPAARIGLRICTAVFAAVDMWHILNLAAVTVAL